MESKNVKRLIRSKSGLKIVSAQQSPFLLCEPSWIPDNEATCCMECKKKFDFLTRRHHCRRCGRIYCKKCCEFRVELPRMCFVDPVRQCQLCADITKKENEFFDKDIKMLLGGANFQLSSASSEEILQPSQFICKLSADHRLLSFDGSEGQLDSVELSRITELSIIRTPEQPPGMFLAYSDDRGVCKEMTLLATPDISKRQAVSWLTAMHNAFKMALEFQQDAASI